MSGARCTKRCCHRRGSSHQLRRVPSLRCKLAEFFLRRGPENAREGHYFYRLGYDMVWPYYYDVHILESRRDLTFVETYPVDDVDSVAVSLVDDVAMKLADPPIFFGEREQVLLNAGFDLTPARLGPARLFRVIANE